MTTEQIIEHAKKYSKSYGKPNNAWATNFDDMALKTCLRQLLSKYGIMSVEMQQAFVEDSKDMVDFADQAIQDGDVIDVDFTMEDAVDVSEETEKPQEDWAEADYPEGLRLE